MKMIVLLLLLAVHSPGPIFRGKLLIYRDLRLLFRSPAQLFFDKTMNADCHNRQFHPSREIYSLLTRPPRLHGVIFIPQIQLLLLITLFIFRFALKLLPRYRCQIR